MHDFFNQLIRDPWGRLLIQFALDDGLARAGLSLLVVARLAGLLGVGLFLGRTLLTWQVRVGLVVLLTLVVVPTLPLARETVPQVQLVGHAGAVSSKGSHRDGLRLREHGDVDQRMPPMPMSGSIDSRRDGRRGARRRRWRLSFLSP